MNRKLVCVVAMLVAGACTNTVPRVVATTSGPSPGPTPAPSPKPVLVRFEAARAIEHDRVFSVRIGSREAASAAYVRAAEYAAAQLTSYGYHVVRQRVAIPAGTSEKVPVGAGTSVNVIAYPQDYDPAQPHVVVGGHLDTVVPSPGANDNGSGAATIIELARLASLRKTRLPAVFVEFTGEERRFKGPSGALFGSRRYLKSLSGTERRSLKGVLNIDMVANGPVVLVCHHRAGASRRLLDVTLGQAHRLKIPARENLVTKFFSDSLLFEYDGVPVAWLWSGDNPTVHTARDRIGIVRAADLAKSGTVAWQTLLVFAG
ncbi:MAG: M28 family metallopeptidase [Actinomycetota bacterium]|nr:M28 family peptidase [Actinomycetota bacterium]